MRYFSTASIPFCQTSVKQVLPDTSTSTFIIKQFKINSLNQASLPAKELKMDNSWSNLLHNISNKIKLVPQAVRIEGA